MWDNYKHYIKVRVDKVDWGVDCNLQKNKYGTFFEKVNFEQRQENGDP